MGTSKEDALPWWGTGSHLAVEGPGPGRGQAALRGPGCPPGGERLLRCWLCSWPGSRRGCPELLSSLQGSAAAR